MNGFLQDLRFGIRQLAAKPGFAAAAILTLALGIGANTAVFSFLSGYLFKPLPYPNAEQLVSVNVLFRKQQNPVVNTSLPIYRVEEQQANSFAATAFYTYTSLNLKTGGSARQIAALYSSASLFEVLSVKPLLGRAFSADNMHKGRDHVAVISYGMWRSSFGADPNVIGKTVKINGNVWRIIGVMPKGFAFPRRNIMMWAPYQIMPDELSANAATRLHLRVIGRLKSGINQEAAAAQVEHVVTTWFYAHASADQQKAARSFGFAASIQPWRQVLVGTRATSLWLLQGAVLLILLITCVNVANLLLSRILGRSHELAMRSALGASRAVLARQLLGEALCLTMPGGLIGVALWWLALHFLNGSAIVAGNDIFNIALGWRVGLFAFGAVLFTAALVSVLPIRRLADTDLNLVLQEGGRTSGSGRGAKRTRNALVIAELTLATGLLAVAGLLLHSFMNLENIDTGFRKDHVLVASLLVPKNDYTGKGALNSFYANLRQHVNALPGVEHVGISDVMPFGNNDNDLQFNIPGRAGQVAETPHARINSVGPGYFRALGIPFLRGGSFVPQGGHKHAAIIDATIAQKYFHALDPVGKEIAFNGTKYSIVGVVPALKYHQLSQELRTPTIYLNLGEETESRGMHLVIHTKLPPNELVRPLESLIHSLDSNVAVYGVGPMREQVADSLSEKQTTMLLLLAFGGIALALAIVGVYAVMRYAVGQRRAECGVRLALGAQPEDIQRLVLKDGLRLLVTGLVLGLGLAVLFGYLLSAQLFGVAPFDPATLIGSAVVLCLVTLAACWLPARRAAKLDPAVAMMEQ